MVHQQYQLRDRVVFILGVIVLAYLVVRGFSDLIGVDIEVGGRLLFSVCLCAGLIAYAAWNALSGGLFGFRALLPLALATLWVGLWPAMQVWGAEPIYLAGMPLDDTTVQWWAKTNIKWGGWAALLFGGYAISYFSLRFR